MARARDSDDDDDDPEDRPRNRKRGRDDDHEDDESEERPRRRKWRRDDDYEDDDDYDDDDYSPRPKRRQLGPLDQTFRDTNVVVLVLFACLCRGLAFLLAVICLLTAKDDTARRNSIIVLAIDGIAFAILAVLFAVGKL